MHVNYNGSFSKDYTLTGNAQQRRKQLRELKRNPKFINVTVVDAIKTRVKCFHKPEMEYNACACIGPQYNEPHCPCTMRRLGLPPSQERLDAEAYHNTPEFKEEQEKIWNEFKSALDTNR